MMADRRLLHPWPALMILVCAALLASPAAAADWKFRADEHARIEVNGEAQTDARVLATDAPGIYLVELPFESKYVRGARLRATRDDSVDAHPRLHEVGLRDERLASQYGLRAGSPSREQLVRLRLVERRHGSGHAQSDRRRIRGA